ncbi:MAG: transcriptional regulator NrdR [Halobacteriovorax sp.]|nr:transcriptional regulator NrdR [Halobacteriovorax sp.]|tara:strand:- start:72018 stop:72500 length:483 start_codon:yes stop_codon:yes gene_type:complete
MNCPHCNDSDTKVIDSRLQLEGQSVRRRRKCEKCEFRFTTHEKIIHQIPPIVKADGRRETFSKEKVLKGLQNACQKTKLSSSEIDDVVESLQGMLRDYPAKEVPSKLIGEYVMEKLRQLDAVAYIRFASIYWDFNDIEGFVTSLKNNETGVIGATTQTPQ